MAYKQESMRPRKSWRVRLLILFVMSLVGFAVLELYVRAEVGAPMAERLPLLSVRSNPVRGFEMMEGIHYTYHHKVHVNSLGLRGPELEAKAEDEVRVFAVGDSLVYGQGVGDEETLPFYLEGELEELDPSGRPWTVVNGGHRGYDTRQELALIEEKQQEIQADVVVLFWFWNDFLERDIQTSFAKLERRGPVVFDTGDRLEGRALRKWKATQFVRRSALIMYLHDRIGRATMEPFEDVFYENGLKRLAHYLDRFKTLADRQGFVPVVAILPDPNRLAGPHFTDWVDEGAANVIREAALPQMTFLDELLALTRELDSLPILPHDGHYAPPANRVMARVAAREILGLLPVGD